MRIATLLLGATASILLAGCGRETKPVQYGPEPTLPGQHRGLLPTMKIANPAPWGKDRPTVPAGYAITAIATDLQIPRQTLVLPNGDILVAEGRGGNAPRLTPKAPTRSKRPSSVSRGWA